MAPEEGRGLVRRVRIFLKTSEKLKNLFMRALLSRVLGNTSTLIIAYYKHV